MDDSSEISTERPSNILGRIYLSPPVYILEAWFRRDKKQKEKGFK